MCNKCQNNKCSCKQEKTCGCKEVDSKCVIYNGQCLSTLDICEGEDLENIIIIIDSLIQDILNQIEEAWVAANIGGGAELYKGISSLGIHQFRTLIDSVSVNVVENENNISLAVDEAWLEQVIIDIVTDIISNLPDTELDSPLNSISITSTGTNEFELDLNPTTFASPNGSVTITSATIGGVLRINFQVNPSYINSLLPNITNVGLGAQVYKGLNGNTHEFRGFTVEMIPPTNGGQLTGIPTATATVDGDNVKVTVNLSNLTVTPQTFGIPEYYVNSANPENGDGSAVNPFKTWELCKTEIGGTPDTNRNIKVIFQSNITSTEDLTLNGVNFVFQNNSRFTYSGTGPIIDFSKFTGTTSKYIILSGTGSLKQSTNKTATLNAINVVGGNGTFSRTLNIEGNIEVFERERVSNPSTDGDFISVDRLTGGGSTLYGYNEPFVKGTIYVTGRNVGGSSLINIRQGAILTIRDAINPTIQMEGTGSGSSAIVIEGTLKLLHYTNYVRYSTVGGVSPNTYLNYSNDIPRIIIKDGYAIIANNGNFQASHTGSTNSGGYSSLVKITGSQPGNPSDKSTFRVSNNSSFVLTSDVFYRFLFEVDSDSFIEIDNINSRNDGFSGTVEVENIIYSPSSASPTITLRFGNMLWGGIADFLHSNILSTPTTNWLFVQGQPVSSSMGTSAMTNLDNNIYTNSGILTRD